MEKQNLCPHPQVLSSQQFQMMKYPHWKDGCQSPWPPVQRPTKAPGWQRGTEKGGGGGPWETPPAVEGEAPWLCLLHPSSSPRQPQRHCQEDVYSASPGWAQSPEAMTDVALPKPSRDLWSLAEEVTDVAGDERSHSGNHSCPRPPLTEQALFHPELRRNPTPGLCLEAAKGGEREHKQKQRKNYLKKQDFRKKTTLHNIKKWPTT